MSYLVEESQLNIEQQAGKPPMLKVETTNEASSWVAEHRDALRAITVEHGSLLIRGLGLSDTTEVEAVFRSIGNTLMTEREAIESRRAHSEGVYASSKWASNQPMCSHHELSYLCEFPGLMLFACLNGASSGGATGVADAATMLEMLPPGLIERFEREGWLLTRNYNEEMGSSIIESFGTDDRSTIEAYCNANAIEFEWLPDGGLHTRQRRSAIVQHPATGQRCWFNQIAFLNEWTLDPEIREYLIEVFGPEGLPFNTYYGNGEPISEDVVQLLNEIYEANIVREVLQNGDLMLVDNIRTAHSREPFEGEREVLVAMANPVHLADCQPTIEIAIT